MIDLHIHSNCSDGTDSVIDILKKSNNLDLYAISITDHDTLGAYEELSKIDISEYYSGILIPGVEIKTTFNGLPIEILAYNFDINKFNKCSCVNLKRKQEIQNLYLQNFIKVGNSLGIKCNPDLHINDTKHFAAITYYREIIKYPENYKIIPDLLNDLPENFYRNTSCNRNSPFYIDESLHNIPIDIVIQDIHNCGGKSVLAHPFEYKIENMNSFLTNFLNNIPIDGIECYYSNFTETQTTYLINLAKRHNKLISGGTDYHGLNKPTINLGIGHGNLDIPNSIIKELQ